MIQRGIESQCLGAKSQNLKQKCEISVFFNVFSQNLGYNEYRSRAWIVFLCKHTLKNIQLEVKPLNPPLWVRHWLPAHTFSSYADKLGLSFEPGRSNERNRRSLGGRSSLCTGEAHRGTGRGRHGNE